ncbi:polysaccharide deacetylase family protein [Capillimicrobium parvum]|nr:polysaccharide deacetylase family protein [Capillimicrobium parvum]
MAPAHAMLACLGGGVLAAHAVPALAQPLPRIGDLLGVERRVPGPAAVALTFDDGPHPQATEQVLEVLRARRATATFFLVGEQAVRHGGAAAEVAAAGHAIGVHGFRHRNLLRLTPAQTVDDLRRGRAAVAEATGLDPWVYRPPYGVLSGGALREARRRRWRVVLWSRWGRDWRADATAGSVCTLVVAGLAGRDVVLLHDADHYAAAGSWRATVGALPRILDAIQDAGLVTVRL